LSIIWQSNASVTQIDTQTDYSSFLVSPDEPDSMQYPFEDPNGYPFSNSGNNESPLFLKQPANITQEVEYDPKSGTYQFSEKIGRSGLSKTFLYDIG
jgi:hypothetical protein